MLGRRTSRALTSALRTRALRADLSSDLWPFATFAGAAPTKRRLRLPRLTPLGGRAAHEPTNRLADRHRPKVSLLTARNQVVSVRRNDSEPGVHIGLTVRLDPNPVVGLL